MEAWKEPGFGLRLSEAFAEFLARQKRDYEAVKVASEFCGQTSYLRYSGICSFKRKPAHLVRLGRAWSRLGLDHMDYKSMDRRTIRYILRRELRAQKIALGNKGGIVWFTGQDVALGCRTVNDACDQLGRREFTPHHDYIFLGVRHRKAMCRPTIHDGFLIPQFRPACTDHRWGMSVTVCTLEHGVPEVVMQDGEYRSTLLKWLDASGSLLPRASGVAIKEYLKREEGLFRAQSEIAHSDLLNAWTQKTSWWA
jgi:hypothetical protein